MISSIIIALLLLGQVRESHEMLATGDLVRRVVQHGCVGVGCGGWMRRPFDGDRLYDMLDLQRPTRPSIFDEKKKDKEKPQKEKGEAQAPGVPTKEDGFKPPRNWNGEKVPHKEGGYGYPDKGGAIWIPTGPNGHGGPHWDRQNPDGTYDNVFPGGRVVPGKSRPGRR